ncbi:uncharacterized protein LOC132563153 [Ylistrum balloti]|uniref:uncharacterized protein LOC132563153 n=1 Tax=Ylistrum balloti TaxID=509963 RepID=UPI0029059345|nr:uncharacterized protein LOC132563153 [Ylistrum balloti]
MDETTIPKIPAKLITRSKAKSSTGYRQIVNFLDNLSRDETGAPVKWKFNQTGVKLARGIGKKIADAGKQGTALKYDARTSLVKAVLRKKYSASKVSTSAKGKNSSDGEDSPNMISNGDTTLVENEERLLQKSGKSVTKKTGKGKNEAASDLANDETESVPIPRKRGRPPKKKPTQGSESMLACSVDDQKTAESMSKVQSWTNLNQKVFKKSLIGKFMKKNVENISCDDSADSDSRVDSEVETESVSSSVSSVSVKKKFKHVNRTGITLGPAKLLRSQDSLMTRKSKGMKASLVQANRKPRKRTLSGEFELLDENLLRKRLRQDEDHQSDVDSDFSECIQKSSAKLDDSEEECASVTSGLKVSVDMSKKQVSRNCIPNDDRDTSPSMKKAVSGTPTNDTYTVMQNNDFISEHPKKRGRPPRGKPLHSASEQIKAGKKPKLLGPKCAQERARNMLLKKNNVTVPRTGLQIIGPGGLVFMRKSVEQPKQKLCINDNLQGHETDIKLDVPFKEEVSSTTEKYSENDMQSAIKPDISFDMELKQTDESVVKSVHISIDTKENVVPPKEDISKKETKADIMSKTEEESFSSVDVSTVVKCVDGSGQSNADSLMKDSVSDKDHKLFQENNANKTSLSEVSIAKCEIKNSSLDPEIENIAKECEIPREDNALFVSATVIQSPTCESSVLEKVEQENQVTSSDLNGKDPSTCLEPRNEELPVTPFVNDKEINQMDTSNMNDSTNQVLLGNMSKETGCKSENIEMDCSQTGSGENCESLKMSVGKQDITDDSKSGSDVNDSETSTIQYQDTSCNDADRNDNLDVSLESNEVDMYNSVSQYTEESYKKKDDTGGKSGKVSPMSDDERTDTKVDAEKKLGVKREFQLRQKASRSPLEIIAMRQSQEERQYILEQTQKAMKREEKQKKMRERIKKIENDNMEKKEDRKKDEKVRVAEHITEENQDKEDSDELKVSEEKGEKANNAEEQIEKENEHKKIISTQTDCKACSVVLIDFVKYLKMTNSSYSVESGSVMEEWETIEDTETTLSEESAESSVHEETQEVENELLPKLSEEEQNQDMNVPLKSDDDAKINYNKVDENKPTKKKRKPSARKQARPVTYSAQLTAEIVSNPFFTGDETQTVPPLRLKIKQNIIAKPKPRSKKGMKFTVKKRRTARKGMPSGKGLLKTGSLLFQGTDGTAENTAGKNTDSGKSSFENSFVEFYQNSGNELKVKAHRKQKNTKTANQTFSFETITDEETALSKQSHSVNKDQDSTTVFQCTHSACGFVSETKRVMESHIYVHLKNIPFRCVHCNEVFQSRGLTFLHMRSTHPDLDARMEAAEKVEERLYYKEIKQTVPSSLQSPSRETTVIDSSPDPVAPTATSVTTGCYCCSHCDFSAPSQQDILNHIHSFHSNDIQYTCTLCNMPISGSKEGIPDHFAKAHPNQPVTYKCLPEFYDVTKNQQNTINADKGNIFDRMSDLFTNDPQGSNGRPQVQKTSAEADSTTAEMEVSTNKEDLVDGIEELGKSYQPTMEQTSNLNNGIQGIPVVYAAVPTIAGPSSLPLVATGMGIQQPLILHQEPVIENNDMGLKIVDVVSLSDLANTWNQQAEPQQEKTQNTTAVGQANTNSKTPKAADLRQLPNSQLNADPQHAQLQLQYEQRQKQQRLQQKQQQNMKNSDKQECFGTTYKCEKCNVHAPILSAMVEHLRVTHKDIQRLFLCPYCRQYEGSNEPEIHRHIKQFHQTPDQKSPPVALSSAAKRHLRTIQVAVDADSKKVGDKFVVEKDIYKCLKCQKHMPSLNFIYDHLEKTHHEVFVYVCPYCKIFKAKTEAQVFHHIKNEHKKCTEDIMLSLAIEENLFTRVQSLVKEKASKPNQVQKSQQGAKASKGSHDTEDEVIVVGESHKHGGLNMTSSPKSMPANIPAPQTRMRMPMQNANPPPAHFQQSKSSLRKSTPHHIPPQSQHSGKDPFEHQNYQQFNIPRNRHGSAPPRIAQPTTVPPPLMRAPPPLLRFPSDGKSAHLQNVGNLMKPYASQSSGNVAVNATYSHANQRVISQQQGQHLSTAKINTSQDRHVIASSAGQISTARPVLRVPSVATHIQQQQRPDGNMRMSPYQDFNPSPGSMAPVNRKGDGYAPLDLSKSPAPPSRPKDSNDEADDLPPDAFQIFNLRPSSQQIRSPIVQQQIPPMPLRNMSPVAIQARFRQQLQMQQMSRMSPHMVRAARQPMMNRPPPYTRAPRHSRTVPRHYTPRRAINQPMPNVLPPKEVSTPIQSDIMMKDSRDIGGLGQMRVFKCPYCPDVVPLGMGEVAPHIEKVHPGHSIVFMKIDK